MIFVSDPALRRHQFLINLERQHAAGSFTLETGFPTLPAAQREAGEVAVEGLGTLEVASPEIPGLRRMDVREVDRSLAAARGRRCSPRTAISAPPTRRRRSRSTCAASPTRRCSRGRRARRRDDARHHRGAGADRSHHVDQKPRAAVHEGGAAGGRDDAVGRSGRLAGETGRRQGRQPRAAAASGLPARRRLRRLVRLPACRHAVPEEGGHADDAAEDGRPGQRRRVGAVRARSVPRRSLRRRHVRRRR